MTLSRILSKLPRLGLLSVFCMGLFLTSGDLSMSSSGSLQVGNIGMQNALAADCGGTNQPPCPVGSEDQTINTIISFLNLCIGVLTFLVTPLIMLAGWLLSPDWTFGEIFGLRPILHQLWVLVSNVVYVIFGFLLVFVAFANIFGGENAKTYEMKTILPKLVTGMLIVPFTWFIVSAVLSISNILTASVISLPMDTILKAGGTTGGLLEKPIIPKEITYKKGGNFGTTNLQGSAPALNNAGANTSGIYDANGDFFASDCIGGPDQCISISDFLTNGKGGAYNLLSVYAYGVFRIQGYKQISVPEGINKIIDIASKLGFGIIFFIVFGVLIIAIVYALFTRAIMLWLYAIFSPFFALNYVLGDKLKDKGIDNFTITKFVSLALVPVYVSAALAFGLMFLGLVMGATSPGTTGATEGTLKSNTVDISTAESTTSFTFGDITFKTIGLLDANSTSGISSALDIGKGVIGTIIINVLALVVLWMAVMAALGADDITKAAVKPISDMGGSVGELMKNAPSYTPIPGMKGQSMSSMSQGVGQIASTIGRTEAGTQAGKFAQRFTGEAGEVTQKWASLLKFADIKTDRAKQTLQAGYGGGKVENIAKDKAEIAQLIEHARIAGTTVTTQELINNPQKVAEILVKISEAGGANRFMDPGTLATPADVNEQLEKLTSKKWTPDTVPGSTSTSNITILPKIGGPTGDFTIAINGITGVFDINKTIGDNATSMQPVKGLMTKGEFITKMKEHMDEIKVNELVVELEKTADFFKS